MNEKQKCQLLMNFKNGDIRFTSYMGKRWFVSKIILSIAAILLLIFGQEFLRLFAVLILGYLLGMIGSNVRTYVVLKKEWELQRQSIDRKKVEECLEPDE